MGLDRHIMVQYVLILGLNLFRAAGVVEVYTEARGVPRHADKEEY